MEYRTTEESEALRFQRNEEGILKPENPTWRLNDTGHEWARWKNIRNTTAKGTRDLQNAAQNRDVRATQCAETGGMVLRLDGISRAWLGWEWKNYWQPKREIFRLSDFSRYMSVDYSALVFEAKNNANIPFWESSATRTIGFPGNKVPIRYTRVCDATRRIACAHDQLLLGSREDWYPRSDYSRKANDQLTPHIY